VATSGVASSATSLISTLLRFLNRLAVRQHCEMIKLLALLMMAPSLATAQTLLSDEPESEQTMPALPSALLQPLLAKVDQQSSQSFKACLKEQRLTKKDWPLQFRAVALPSPNQGKNLYYVRPSIDTVCRDFYGAHVFQHWIVEYDKARGPSSLQLVFEGVDDGFDILETTAEGRYDVVTKGCHSSGCYITQWRVSHGQYGRYKCWEDTFEENGETTRAEATCQKS